METDREQSRDCFKNGQVIKEGDSVVIDGDKNALFISEGDVLKENELMEEIEEMQSSEDSREDSTDSFDGSLLYDLVLFRIVIDLITATLP